LGFVYAPTGVPERLVQRTFQRRPDLYDELNWK
jgi:hypothetical protein